MTCSCGATYPACPKCSDGWLVERPGKWGKFLGCVKYPDCSGKQSIKKNKGSGASKDASQQSILQKMLDEDEIRNAKQLEKYVASKGWSLKKDKRRAPDGRHMIGIRTAPYEIFRVRTKFDPSSAYLPRSMHGKRK